MLVFCVTSHFKFPTRQHTDSNIENVCHRHYLEYLCSAIPNILQNDVKTVIPQLVYRRKSFLTFLGGSCDMPPKYEAVGSTFLLLLTIP